MDISKLALLCDVADTKNLTLSAERMGYTQSGVSHAISKLEAEMGIPIIKRTKHGVELTSEGTLLMPYIRLVVTHSQRLLIFKHERNMWAIDLTICIIKYSLS